MFWIKLRFWFYRVLIVDCFGCGSLVVHRYGICKNCEHTILKNNLRKETSPKLLSKFGIPYRFLFHWVPGEDEVLSKYVYLLKSIIAEPIWREISGFFLINEKFNQETVLVPIPSRKGRRHSKYFAQGLVHHYGGSILPALNVINTNDKEQKQKSKEERFKIQFSLNEEFTEQLRLATKVILVDDVITTGASYKAAYTVLKNHGVWPENIELWTAFYRESVHIDFE